MSFLRVTSITFFLIYSMLCLGEDFQFNTFSKAKAALVIDSLETVKNTNPDNIDEINYQLAILYYQILVEESKSLALEYLNSKTEKPSEKQIIIYSLLSQIYKNKQQFDSAYYYKQLQHDIIPEVSSAELKNISESFLNLTEDRESSSKFLGLPLYSIIIVVILIILILVLYFKLSHQKKKFSLIETEKNKLLEEANIKLQKFNDDIQQGIMERTIEKAIELEMKNNEIVEIRKSLKKDEEANYLKNAFLGTMSHQIRTPLSGIMGFSTILETELALKGDEELYDFAKTIQQSGQSLMNLISNIIDISSIEANILELKISSLDINEQISSITKEYELKAKDKGLIFKSKMEGNLPRIYADGPNLIKSLKIILDNSVQYTSKGFVTLSTTLRDDSTINIEIKDKGNGIDETTLQLLLDAFDYTKHGSSLTYKGQGLGLILAHRLITLMNGQLLIETTVGKGTTVNVILHSSPEKPSEVETELTKPVVEEKTPDISIISAPDLGRLNILVVEDDRMNRMVIEKMLKKTGDIEMAVDGEDALKKIRKKSKSKKQYDVVLMDINLPAPWDGLKLMVEMRREYSWTKNIPFIAQTAYAMAGDKDMYLDAGFDDYISKPINKNELMTMIQKQMTLFKK